MKKQIGYCTNVHAGADLSQTRANLVAHAVDVKRRFSPDAAMGVGLWLSAQSARQLLQSEALSEFAQWLNENGLVPFTFNGFPFGDFHQPVVKHRVYEPTWWQPDRLDYTLDLIQIQHQLLPSGMPGSISTLPIAWPTPRLTDLQWRTTASQLIAVANTLERLESDHGRRIQLCLEPEPGCALQRGEDIVRFFESYLLPAGNEATARRYVGVCHDVCHSAVMFEGQDDVLIGYQRAGLSVGKFQISSAVCVDFDEIPSDERGLAVEQLRAFAEDRYLHQTSVRHAASGTVDFYADLPEALAAKTKPNQWTGKWHIHFHVPVHLDSFGRLGTSQAQIAEAVTAASRSHPETTHFEVETYAWGVLPPDLQEAELSAGIAKELIWFRDHFADAG